MTRPRASRAQSAPNGELFAESEIIGREARSVTLPEGASFLPGFALSVEQPLLTALADVMQAAPMRHMVTPGGHRMSVAMTNCGAFGWISDQSGYRYAPVDPLSNAPWPALPEVFRALAVRAATVGGYPAFAPDACLVNRYEPGARMSLHQDRNERDFHAPIVSVSLGLTANFQFGGLQRTDTVQRVPLRHGDVVVWGGPSRLAYHGVLPLTDGAHPLLGRQRLNLTFRVAR